MEINIRKCPDILLTGLIILVNTQLIALQEKQEIAQCQIDLVPQDELSSWVTQGTLVIVSCV